MGLASLIGVLIRASLLPVVDEHTVKRLLGVILLPITRASNVEPDDQGRWLADLSTVRGQVALHQVAVERRLETRSLPDHKSMNLMAVIDGVPGSAGFGSASGAGQPTDLLINWWLTLALHEMPSRYC
jgi:hypothetical protein